MSASRYADGHAFAQRNDCEIRCAQQRQQLQQQLQLRSLFVNFVDETKELLAYSEGQKSTIVELYKKCDESMHRISSLRSDLEGHKRLSTEQVRTEIAGCKQQVEVQNRKLCADLETRTQSHKQDLDRVRTDVFQQINDLKRTSVGRLCAVYASAQKTAAHRPGAPKRDEAHAIENIITRFPESLSQLISLLHFYRDGLAVEKLLANPNDSFESKQARVSEAKDAFAAAQACIRDKVASEDGVGPEDLEHRDIARRAAHQTIREVVDSYSQHEAALWEGHMQARELGQRLEALLVEKMGLEGIEAIDATEAVEVPQALQAACTWWSSRASTSNAVQEEVDRLRAKISQIFQNVTGIASDLAFDGSSDLGTLLDSLEEAAAKEEEFYRDTDALMDFPKDVIVGAAALLHQRCAQCCSSIEHLHRLMPDWNDELVHLDSFLHAKPDAEGKVDRCLQKVKQCRKELIQLRAQKEAALEDEDENELQEIDGKMRPVKAAMHQADKEMRQAVSELCKLREHHFPELRLPPKTLPSFCTTAIAHMVSSCADPHQLFDKMMPLQADHAARHKLWQACGEQGEWVLKEFPLKDESVCRALQRQLRMMLRLRNPCVVPIEAAFWDAKRYVAYIQMPKFKCNLAEWVDNKPAPEQARAVLTGIVHALAHVHSCGVVHGDVKLQNVVMDEHDAPVLTDFEFSHDAEKGTVTSSIIRVAGTVDFMAPEIQEGAPSSKASDIYSLGVVLGTLAPLLRDDLKDFATQVSDKMMCPNPQARPTIQEILKELAQHRVEEEARTVADAGHAKSEREALRIRQAEIEEQFAQREAQLRAAGAAQTEEVSRARDELLTERQTLARRRWELEAEVPPPPAYWVTKRLGEPTVALHTSRYAKQQIERILNKASTCCNQPRFNVLWVERVENVFLWKSYCRKRREISERHEAAHERIGRLSPAIRDEHRELASLDAATNESFLLHGCKGGLQVAKITCQQGFDERVSNLRGLYGGGIYTAEQSCKSLQYAQAGPDGRRYALYCRVTMGKAHHATGSLQGERRAPAGHDSVVASRGVANGGNQHHREFIVYDRNQIYPEFLVCFTA